MILRRFAETLIDDPVISDKLLLLAGPRQVGKTTTAKKWLESVHHKDLYFNWDDEKTRRMFRQDAHFFESRAWESGKNARIVFDEIHKISNWKTILKGYFDTFGKEFRFLVTGSARLELFQRSGDSMLGRYHLMHLCPLIPNEIEGCAAKPNYLLFMGDDAAAHQPVREDTIETLMHFSGFPEQYLKQSERSLRLWRREYRQQLLREDLRDLTKITDLNRAEHLAELLPLKIGSPISLNTVREDLYCSYDAVKTLLTAFEKLYFIMLIRPFSRNIRNTLSREPKLYLTDWSQVPDEKPRFENFMAVQLKTFCDYVTDSGLCSMELFYVRDRQKHETDFLLVQNGIPAMLIEAKLTEDSLDRNLKFFSSKLPDARCIQVVKKSGIFKKISKSIWILSVNRFFNMLWNYSQPL